MAPLLDWCNLFFWRRNSSHLLSKSTLISDRVFSRLLTWNLRSFLCFADTGSSFLVLKTSVYLLSSDFSLRRIASSTCLKFDKIRWRNSVHSFLFSSIVFLLSLTNDDISLASSRSESNSSRDPMSSFFPVMELKDILKVASSSLKLLISSSMWFCKAESSFSVW